MFIKESDNMFNIKHLGTGEVSLVYGVRYSDSNRASFLLYRDGAWTWVSSSSYRPIPL